jgi:tetratricopeptide (TPR) repeat protein
MFATRVKSLLKRAREEIAAKRFAEALVSVQDALDYEPENLNALLFKALACQNLNQWEESESTLLKIVTLNPELLSAYQVNQLKFIL